MIYYASLNVVVMAGCYDKASPVCNGGLYYAALKLCACYSRGNRNI